jgi:hypothetical protein
MEKKNLIVMVVFGLIVVLGLILFGCDGSGHDKSVEGESINGIAVPPAPNADEDNVTVAGVDTNNNGIRDSVERVIAAEFGQDNKDYHKAMEYAEILQVAMVDPSEENVKMYAQLLSSSVGTEESSVIKTVDDTMINTDDRIDACRNAFAGMVVTIEN